MRCGKVLLGLVMVSTLVLSGCASKRAAVNSQVEALQIKVSDLERELDEKNVRISELEEDSRKGDTGSGVSYSKPTPKAIQTALKNAGYYDGSIDGKIGKKSAAAIKAFQKENGLKSDGVVGQKTWTALRKYLE